MTTLLNSYLDDFSIATRGYVTLVALAAPLFILTDVFGSQSDIFSDVVLVLVVGSVFWRFVRFYANKSGISAEPFSNPSALSLFRTRQRGNVLKIDEITLNRYHQTLEKHIPNWVVPTLADERDLFEQSYQKYESAVIWLRENTRSREKFPLVYAELIEYTRQKTFLGVRTAVLIIHFCFLLYVITALHLTAYTLGTIPQFSHLFDGIGFIHPIVVLLSISYWCLFVNKDALDAAAAAYNSALLRSIDALK